MRVGKMMWMALFLPFIFVTNVKAVQRVVVMEEFTGTWCHYCPEAARALHQLEKEAKDTLACMAFHLGSSDPFTTSETNSRANYYSVPGVPVTWMDGTIYREGAYSYSTYRADFNTRKNVSAPLQIELTGSYNAGTGQGNVNAHVTNTTGNTVSGNIHFVLTETDKAYSWQGEDSLFHIVRDMIPNASGEAVSIPGSGVIDKSREFTVSTSWNANKCDIIVFVQGSSKEIYQGAKMHIVDVSVEENPKSEIRKLEISPNPFSEKTVIRYLVPINHEDLLLTIYDLSGCLIRTFPIHGPRFTIHEVTWDGKDSKGVEVPTGIYFLKLSAGKTNLTKKLIVAK